MRADILYPLREVPVRLVQRTSQFPAISSSGTYDISEWIRAGRGCALHSSKPLKVFKIDNCGKHHPVQKGTYHHEWQAQPRTLE